MANTKSHNLLLHASAVFFDFDGVIKDSVNVKGEAFEKIFIEYGAQIASNIKSHHYANGGMSRYEKLPIYLKKAGVEASEHNIKLFANHFSAAVTDLVISSPWVPGMPDYLIQNVARQDFFLITATPQKEIEMILDALGIQTFFLAVLGAPTTKSDALTCLINRFNVDPLCSVYLGDSEVDYDAATGNGVPFILKKTPHNIRLQEEQSLNTIPNFLALGA